MRRSLIVILIFAGGIVASSILWAIVWVSGDRFDRYMRRRLQESFLRFNVRAEVAAADLDLRSRTLRIRDLRLFPASAREPLVDLHELRMRFALGDLFRRDIFLEDVEIVRARLHIETDATGRTNIEAIDLSPLGQRGEKGYTVRIGHLAVREGTLEIRDARFPLELKVQAVTMSVHPEQGRWRLDARSGRAEFTAGHNHERRRIARLDLSAWIDREQAAIERIRLLTGDMEFLATGRIAEWSSPRYEFDIRAEMKADGLPQPEPRASQGPQALTLVGRIEGSGSNYRIEGVLDAQRLALQTMTIEKVRARLAGSTAGEQIFSAAMTTTAGVFVTRLFRFHQLEVGSTLVGFPPRAAVQGGLRLATGTVGFLPFENARARFRATPEEVYIEDIRASTFGGIVQGEAVVRFSGRSEVNLRLRGISLAEIVMWSSGRRLPLAGGVDGVISATWPGLSLERLKGEAHLALRTDEHPHPQVLATRGTIAASFTGSTISLSPTPVTIGATTVRASGTISWNGDVALHLEGRSEDLSEQEMMLAAGGVSIQRLTRGLVPRLSGSAQFDLRVNRTKRDIHIRGTTDVQGLAVAGEPVTSITSEFIYDGHVLEFTRMHAHWRDGAAMDVSLRIAPESESRIAVRGRFVRINTRAWAPIVRKDLPVVGRMTGTLALTDVPSAPRGHIEAVLTEGEVRLGEGAIPIPRATGRVVIERSRYAWDGLVAEIGGGTARLEGWIDTATKEFDLKGQAQGVAVRTLMSGLGLNAEQISGRLNATVIGEGTTAEPHLQGQIRLTDIVIKGRPAGHIEAELRRQGKGTTFTVVPTLFGQAVPIHGRVERIGEVTVASARALVERFDMTPYLRLAGVSDDVTAVFWGQIEANLPLQKVEQIELRALVSQLRLALGEYVVTNRRPFAVEVLSSRVRIESVSLTGENTDLDLGGVLDLGEALKGSSEEILTDVTLTGRVDLRLLRTFYPGLFARGMATIRGVLRGSFAHPRLSGVMDISGAALRLLDWPLSLVGGHGRIRFTADQALIEGLRAQVNGGDLALSGGVVLRNFKADRWRIVMRAEGVQMSYPTGFRSVLDGDLVLQGNRQLQVLSGTVSVRRAEYHEKVDLARLILAEDRASGQPSLRGIETKPPVTLDVRVQGLDAVLVRNNLADVVGSAWFHIGGTLAAPRLVGTAIISRGTLRFRDRDYQITRGRVDFPEALDARPRFTVEAETDIRGYRVIVGFVGTLDRFQTSLRSEPTLTVDEIVSLVTTGDFTPRPRASVAPTTAGVGTAANLLLSELTHRAEEFTGKFFGINRFQLDPLVLGRGSDPTARITIGRQVTRDLSILYSTNLSSAQEQVIIVEYRLSNRFSLVGVRDQDGNFSFDLRIRKRF